VAPLFSATVHSGEDGVVTPYKLGDGSLTIEDDTVVLTFEDTTKKANPQRIPFAKITIVELKAPVLDANGYLRFVLADTALGAEFQAETDLNTLTLTNDEQYKNVLEAMDSLRERIAGAKAGAHKEMAPWMKCALGIWIIALSAIALGHLPWAWTIADRLKATPTIRVHWFMLTFAPKVPSILVLIVILTAVIGSAATLALTFAQRAGHGTLQQEWSWWYLTRPFTAAGIGVLAYALLEAGFISTTTSAGKTDAATSGLLAAAAIGGLAGLFTDQLLQKMSTALGLTSFKIRTNADGNSGQTANSAQPADETSG
jgi:hypothetical protein